MIVKKSLMYYYNNLLIDYAKQNKIAYKIISTKTQKYIYFDFANKTQKNQIDKLYSKI